MFQMFSRKGAGAIVAFTLALGGCNGATSGKSGSAEATTKERLANRQRLQRTCASSATYDRLKVVMFDKAAQVRGGRADALDRLEAESSVRMESPVVKGRNEDLNVTVCAGRLVLELPPGAERVFNGDRRLKADVEYSAQQAVDNSGIVYQMQGADPIVYRLSAIDLGRRVARAAPMSPPAVTANNAAPNPAPAPPPVAKPAIVATPLPVRPVERVATRETPPAVVRPRSVIAPPVAQSRTRLARSRPSFDCSRARLRVETMICTDDRLAGADRAMSATFFRALASADPDTRSRLRESRGRFLAFRNRCTNEDCVGQAYSDRMDELRDIADGR